MPPIVGDTTEEQAIFAAQIAIGVGLGLTPIGPFIDMFEAAMMFIDMVDPYDFQKGLDRVKLNMYVNMNYNKLKQGLEAASESPETRQTFENSLSTIIPDPVVRKKAIDNMLKKMSIILKEEKPKLLPKSCIEDKENCPSLYNELYNKYINDQKSRYMREDKPQIDLYCCGKESEKPKQKQKNTNTNNTENTNNSDVNTNVLGLLTEPGKSKKNTIIFVIIIVAVILLIIMAVSPKKKTSDGTQGSIGDVSLTTNQVSTNKTS